MKQTCDKAAQRRRDPELLVVFRARVEADNERRRADARRQVRDVGRQVRRAALLAVSSKKKKYKNIQKNAKMQKNQSFSQASRTAFSATSPKHRPALDKQRDARVRCAGRLQRLERRQRAVDAVAVIAAATTFGLGGSSWVCKVVVG